MDTAKTMFRNFITSSLRNLLRNRVFALINIAGLATGMAACIMIAQYVFFEKSFDRFHQGYENIYRAVNVRFFPTHTDESAGCVTALGPALKEMFPEVVNYARCYKSERTFNIADKKSVHFSRVFYVDSTFLDVFSFRVINGSRTSLLSKPQTVVLTVSSAKTLFGDQDPVGETIFLYGEQPYLVEAVVKDPPPNSHMQFDMLVSLVTSFQDPGYCWSCNNRHTYIQLSPGTDPTVFEKNIQRVIAKIHPEKTLRREYRLQSLASIHLHSNIRFEHEVNGNNNSVIALTIIAALILFIAWLNYINLTTAVAITRANEVGIRKVNGSTRKNLIFQFLAEAMLVNLFALSVALVITQLAFPFVSTQLGTYQVLTLFHEPLFWLCLFGGLILGSLVYGFYPAFVISSFKPLEAIKGKALAPKGANTLRTTLVFIQFTFAIMLTVATLAVYQQITFMKNLDLGMDIDQTLVIDVPPLYTQQGDEFADELSSHPTIRAVTYCSEVPGNEIGTVGMGHRTEGVPIEQGHQMSTLYVGENYFDFFSIRFLAGSNFISRETNNTPNTELIINDAARKALGFKTPEEALGKIIYQNNSLKGRISAVVQDHHYRSADRPISFMIFQYTRGKGHYLIKTEKNAIAQNLQIIEKAFGKHFANNPFDYYFLDAHFNAQYEGFEHFGNSFTLFTSLAIAIACLGLAGLTMYVVKSSAKEIALRKVLGASVTELLLMVSKRYTLLLTGAFIIAAPVSWYGVHQWLQGFAYRIDLHWTMLAIPGLAVMIIAWVTIAAQSLGTMLKNPIDSLRSE